MPTEPASKFAPLDLIAIEERTRAALERANKATLGTGVGGIWEIERGEAPGEYAHIEEGQIWAKSHGPDEFMVEGVESKGRVQEIIHLLGDAEARVAELLQSDL